MVVFKAQSCLKMVQKHRNMYERLYIIIYTYMCVCIYMYVYKRTVFPLEAPYGPEGG